MNLNTSGVADVCWAALEGFNAAVGEPPVERGEVATTVMLQSVEWIIENPTLALLGPAELAEAWGKDPSALSDNEFARIALVQGVVVALCFEEV